MPLEPSASVPSEPSAGDDRLARIERVVNALAQQPVITGTGHSDHVEPIVWALLATTMLLVTILIVVSKWSPNDGQTFQVVASLATGFAGAVLARIKPAGDKAVAGGKEAGNGAGPGA